MNKRIMKQAIKFQIHRANQFIIQNDWAGSAFCQHGWTSRPTSQNAWRTSDKRAIKAAAKLAAKAFERNPNGTYRRCWQVRAAARQHLARTIFERADACMCAMLEENNEDE